MSSLPPNAPPLDTSSTVTRSRVDAEHRAMSLRSSHTPWPPEYTCIVPRRRASGTASVASGSRNACSMRCVWNTSCTTWALAASAASTSPRRVLGRRQHVGVGAPHRDLRVVDRGHRVGDRRAARRSRRRRAAAAARACWRVVGHDDGEHVAGVRGAPAHGDQHRPVLVDEPDAQLAGDVGGGEHGDDARRASRGADVSMRDDVGRGRASVRWSAACSMPGTREVVDVVAVAERQLARLVLQRRWLPTPPARSAARAPCPAATASIASRIFT